MEIERRTADNTAIVLVDYVTGFANMVGSQTLAQNVAGARALAQTAATFGVPLVVTLGPPDDPRGGLYPELDDVLGDAVVVHRTGSFDAFDHPAFADAVAATGRSHLVVAGLMSDGCVLQTSLGARRRDYGVSLVVDASASDSAVGHEAAVRRLGMVGVIPTTWLSLASELQRTYDAEATVAGFRRIQANHPGYAKLQVSIAAAVAFGRRAR